MHVKSCFEFLFLVLSHNKETWNGEWEKVFKLNYAILNSLLLTGWVIVEELWMLTLLLLWWIISLWNTSPALTSGNLTASVKPCCLNLWGHQYYFIFYFYIIQAELQKAFCFSHHKLLLWNMEIMGEVSFYEMYALLFILRIQWKQRNNFLSNSAFKSKSTSGQSNSIFPCKYASA